LLSKAGITATNIISKRDFSEIAFQVPPSKKEQSAIASVLSDIDELIENLDKLIEKKKLIKQGAMQELLTGKRRLPMFSGDWEVKRIGEVLEYEQPTKYIVKNTEYNKNASIPVLTAGKTFILGYTEEKNGVFKESPVIIFDDFTTENKYVDFAFKVKSSAMKILKLKNFSCDLRFIYGKIQFIDLSLNSEHKRYWISEYQNIEINVPKLSEQQAIASVLSDMDAEIEALEQKKDKYKQIKQGAMQVLLTGKIRLI
jgi:type I restriction enzyme S subunit